MTIPKILHFIWLGELPIPSNIINTWRHQHQDWKIQIWRETELDALPMINKDIYDESTRYNQKSDIARLEIMYQFGGVYCDTDIICMKSINPLIERRMFWVQEKRGVVSNSIIGSVRNNTHILDLIMTMKERFDKTEAVWKTTGPKFITSRLLEQKLILPFESDRKYDYVSTKNVTVFPYYYVNMNHDHSQKFMNVDINQSDMERFKGNKDEKYVRYNKLDDECIFAVQLWGGSKREFYKDILQLNIDQYQKNMYRYIIHINRLMDMYNKSM